MKEGMQAGRKKAIHAGRQACKQALRKERRQARRSTATESRSHLCCMLGANVRARLLHEVPTGKNTQNRQDCFLPACLPAACLLACLPALRLPASSFPLFAVAGL